MLNGPFLSSCARRTHGSHSAFLLEGGGRGGGSRSELEQKQSISASRIQAGVVPWPKRAVMLPTKVARAALRRSWPAAPMHASTISPRLRNLNPVSNFFACLPKRGRQSRHPRRGLGKWEAAPAALGRAERLAGPERQPPHTAAYPCSPACCTAKPACPDSALHSWLHPLPASQATRLMSDRGLLPQHPCPQGTGNARQLVVASSSWQVKYPPATSSSDVTAKRLLQNARAKGGEVHPAGTTTAL